MRKLTIGMLVLIVLLATFGCGNKEEAKVEKKAGKAQETSQIRMDPLPFKKVLSGLDNLSKELAFMTPKEAFKVDENVYRQSFAMGVISADAVMTISSREEDKLRSYTESLIGYSKNIGLKDDILKMADEIQITLSRAESDKWNDLEKLVMDYQTKVEITFYHEDMLDQYTLMQLGGWTEGLHRISGLFLKNWDEKGAKIINQRGIVNSLINNLENINSKNIKTADYYNVAVEGYAKIKDIIYSKSETEFYSKDELQMINDITLTILKSMHS